MLVTTGSGYDLQSTLFKEKPFHDEIKKRKYEKKTTKGKMQNETERMRTILYTFCVSDTKSFTNTHTDPNT